jgi:hypothetical protein
MPYDKVIDKTNSCINYGRVVVKYSFASITYTFTFYNNDMISCRLQQLPLQLLNVSV